jgi:hypothetical protein
MNLQKDQKMYGVVENLGNHGLISIENEIMERSTDFIESLVASGKVNLIMVNMDKFTKAITFVNTREEAEKMRNFWSKNLINSKKEN